MYLKSLQVLSVTIWLLTFEPAGIYKKYSYLMLVSTNLNGFTHSVQPLKWTGHILIFINTSMRISTLKQQLLNSHTTENIWRTCFPLWKVLINSVSAVILRTHVWTVELQHGLAKGFTKTARLRSKTGALEQLVP